MKDILPLVGAALCFAVGPVASDQLIDFESDTIGTAPDGWVFDGDTSEVRVAATTPSGDYLGGQAIRTDPGGASFAGYAYAGPTIRAIEADFLWDRSSDGTPTLIVYAWSDADGNGFQSGERTIGFGLDNDEQFELSSEVGELPGSVGFSADTWYRLTMTWSEPDGSGGRLVTLSVIDLTHGSDLGVVSSATMSAADFGAAPAEWDGLAFRMTRGTIDNIRIVADPPAFSGESYTFVDATPSNTTLNADPLNAPGGVPLVAGENYVDDGSFGSGTDGLWTYRTDAAFASFEGGAGFESDGGSFAGDAETTSDLITTVTLPSAGTHEIVAVFSRSNHRDIAARIGAGPNAGDVYDAGNALDADQEADPLEIEFDGSFANSRGANSGVAYLGTVTTTSDNEEVRVFINGFARTAETDDERTQYEGIGYRSSTAPVTVHRDVFILAGQSNCDGRGLKSGLTGPLAQYAGPQSGVLIHYTNPAYTNSNKSLYRKWVTLQPGFSKPPGDGGAIPTSAFGMEIGAGKVLADHYEHPAFIKVAEGGTALGVPGRDWYPAPLGSPDVGPLYEALIESTTLALTELENSGDTYTVHGLFWHQGESDGNRTAEYQGLLTNLVESVRRDLDLPNLRFLVGELSPTKPQDFRDVQWQTARAVSNANFISSRGLSTSDGTHFTTASVITFGERVGRALLPARDSLDFEEPMYAAGALDRQDECAATGGLASALEVVATASDGEYAGGQAAGHPGASGAHHFSRRHFLPLAGARMMQADFFSGDVGFDDEADADSSLLVAGWGVDVGGDGLFTEDESTIGFGLDASGAFRIQVGSNTHLAAGFNYQADHWYRLTLQWSEADAEGNRSLKLSARDLSTGIDLNEGAGILNFDVSSSAFNGEAVRWSGLGCRATRGLIDNVRIVPPGFASWSGTFHPELSGGPLDDDDRDGLANLIEFAFGLDPLSPNASSDLPQPVFGATQVSLSFVPLAGQPGIVHGVEWSRSLDAWQSVAETRLGNLLEFLVPTESEAILFMRHRVALSE